MSLEKIQQLVGSINKSLEDNEKIATPLLAAKITRYCEAYPHDQTLGAMSRVISQMSVNNTMFIRRAELKNLYNKLYSRNTKFAELFQAEMGITENIVPETVSLHDEGKNLNPYEVADPVLANALNSVFDKTLPVKMYSQKLAEAALKTVSNTLDIWGIKPTSISVNDGNEKFIIIKADYETPKGLTSFYIPTEILNNKISQASIFIGNSGPKDLSNANIKSYLNNYTGSKLKVSGTNILDVFTKAASENREISDTEIALTKLNVTRQGKSEFFANQIVGQKIVEASVQDVKLPKYDEFESFEKSFSSVQGQANLQFGKENVKIGRDHIARELSSFGYSASQVSTIGLDDNTIFYGVSLDSGKIAFTVPVKVNNGKLSKPCLMLCNGTVSSFDKEDINNLYVNNQTDYKIAAAASPSYGLKSSELVEQIKQASAEGNNVKAEDALNVLAQSGDEKAYAFAFQSFMNSLNQDATKTADKTCCSRMVNNSSSQHPICGHTGLPIHKVFQDKYGNCQPLYRKGMAENYEGAIFNNSKIFG